MYPEYTNKFLTIWIASSIISLISISNVQTRITASLSFKNETVSADDPDQFRTIDQLIESRGFKVEHHSVETNDGYILLIHRILNPLKNDSTNIKPIILQHGLFGASSDFLINSPFLHSNNSKYGDNIAFALMQTGRYDVWLPNSRGNRYSLQHRNRSASDREFWNFSWDQMATEDLPAIIEYIRSRTKHQTVAYVGYSQGTTIMFTLLSLHPEYSSIIDPFVALAPVTFVNDLKTPISHLSISEPILRLIGGEFLPSPKTIDAMADALCSKTSFQSLCANLMFLFGGFDPEHLNTTRIGVYLHFTPSTTSTWDLAHWAQLTNRKVFQRFDYGSANKNRQKYGVPSPPMIPLEKIPTNAKIALFQGLNDELSTPNNLEILRGIFRKSGLKPILDYIIPNSEWTHLDFIVGRDSGKLFIDKMVEILDLYNSD
ncbi:Lysosomal acid lipase/cholesteryl ester hydrolase [Sarcoptes scabiei]|uniref:Lipase n=1 Tax=Sarcoptes scabiei TaxID=52283 RepID=A0A834VE16_SARSC|nr:Lysosomal acid lipase/cholesteryl ester hydrolase [Sarcoptes scabiei]